MLDRRLIVRLFAAASCAVLFTVALEGVERAIAGPSASQFSGRICTSMAEMLAFGTGLNEETLRSQVRQSATIIVTDSGTDYLLQSMSLPATRIAKPDVSSDSCRIFSEKERLGNLGAIKAVYIQAFNDVMRYRATHSWPLGAASTNPAQVDVLAAAYGPYVVIWLLDNFLHRDSSGKVELGCSGHENYRVQTATSEVLPFDDCVESHTAVFPALSQLPQ